MKHWWKWLLGILALIIVIILSGAWYLSRNWKPILEAKLHEVVRNSSDSLYTLTFADLDINIPFGNITLDSVELIPNPAVYQRLVQSKDAPNNQYHIRLNALKIKHFSLTDIFFNRKLTISSIVLQEPDIHMTHEYHAFNDTVSTKPKKSLYDHIKSAFSEVNINAIQVDNANFTYTNMEGGKASNLSVKKVVATINDILIDSTSQSDPSRLFYTKRIDVQVPGFTYDLPGGFYKVQFDNLHINSKDQYLELTNVIYKPKMSNYAFYKKLGKNTTINDLKFQKVRLNKLDFKRLIDKQQIFGSTAEISNGTTIFSEDLRFPGKPKINIGRAPYQQLMKVKNLFHFNTVYINNVSVIYKEFSKKYNQEGTISFNNATGTLTNVTNDRFLLKNNKFMYADLTAKVMDIGKLHVKFGFDMLSKNGSYTYVGTLAPMSATAFNRILLPLVNIEILSGDIKGISFNMKATDYKNWGTFRFDYDNLKVDILSKPKDGKDGGTKKTLSYIVNKVLINSSNPDAKGVYHVGIVEYTRVPEYSFFKTIWQSLLKGIVQCAGISAKQEAQLMGVASTSGKVVTEVKKIAKGVDNVAKKVGKEVGKDASKAFHATDGFLKKVFKKKKKDEE